MKLRQLLSGVLAFTALHMGALAEMPVMEDDELITDGYHTVIGALIGENERPDAPAIALDGWIIAEGEKADNYMRGEQIHLPMPEFYSVLEGITTFRGSNYRDRAAYGTIGGEPNSFELKWKVNIGGLDSWTGVGWTGQCSIVRWPYETVAMMNIYDEKKTGEPITEVIYAALDGKIRFLDLEDGTPTRDPISIGAPIKGSVSVDPRGYPLLYCGQGIAEVHGQAVKIGTRIFSLIDGSVLYFIDGRDGDAYRHWYAFDSAPLIDRATDTMIQAGENGIIYTIKLNTRFDAELGQISVEPETVKYVYKSNVTTRPGIENSPAVYNNYAFFVDNSGLLQCLDLNTMESMWVFPTGDDTDASVVLEQEEDGNVALYIACELDLRGTYGDCHMRKFDALTGREVWRIDEPVNAIDANGGAFATPAVGKGSLGQFVYFHIARTSEGGTIFCADKQTGKVVWRRSLKNYGWSSPACVYSDSGRGYVVVGSSSGQLRLLDGVSGELVCDCDLGANIEGSPTIFNDTLVVGTRGQKIIALKFSQDAAR